MRHRTSILRRPTGGGAARSRRAETLHHGDTYSGPESCLFQTAEEVKAYLAEKKEAWDR